MLNGRSLAELLTTMEPLHEDLTPYVFEAGMGMKALQSPLVYHVPFGDNMAAFANAQYLHKKELAKKFFEEKKWSSYVFLHERPWRIQALKECIAKGLDKTPKNYWDLVSEVWCDSENVWQSFEDWKVLWTDNAEHRSKYVMNKEERKALGEMPESFAIWRGVSRSCSVKGMSWTVDQDQAVWFAKRFSRLGEGPLLVSGTVQKSDVLAYFLRRNEKEIVVLPEDVSDLQVESVSY